MLTSLETYLLKTWNSLPLPQEAGPTPTPSLPDLPQQPTNIPIIVGAAVIVVIILFAWAYVRLVRKTL